MSYLKCTCRIQVKVCFPKKEIDYLMLLNKVVVKTLDARGKLVKFKTWLCCSDNVT